MPELPEVETVMQALKPELEGETILSCSIHNSKLREPITNGVKTLTEGKRIKSLSRRAKFILVELDESIWLVLHLGMTGSWRIVNSQETLLKHEHLCFELSNGMSWRYRDPRRFGFVRCFKQSQIEIVMQSLGNIGPEPLSNDFDGHYLHNFCHNRKKPIKNIIMDMSCVAGVGNIYASESLFLAGIHPQKSGEKISRNRCQQLADAIKLILKKAIEAGGTTISDFQAPDGSEGYFFRELLVYGRENDDCPKCGKAIINIKMSGRSTFFCSRCQKR